MLRPRVSRAKADWLVPAALVVLSIVPVIVGISRISNLVDGSPVSTEDARFFLSPAPVAFHVFAVSTYCLLGAFQFSPGLGRRHPRWHRNAGRLLIPCGLLAAATGLWMTQFYAHIGTDSLALYLMRISVGGAMIAAIILAIIKLRRRDFPAHGDWMSRAYALGQGAGTQVLTHLPWFLLIGTPGPRSRAVLMAAGWIINIAVAEWVIQGRRRLRCHGVFSGEPHRGGSTVIDGSDSPPTQA